MSPGEELLDAARAGDPERIRAILAATPAALDFRNEMGQSAILLAQYHRKPEVVALLRAHGPELTVHEACAVGDLPRVQDLVVNRPRAIDEHAKDGFTPLALACFFGHSEVAAWLVDRGAAMDLAAENPMKVAPLHAAVSGRHGAIVELLLKNGASVNRRQQQGFTPLHGAAQSGDSAMVRLLLEYGADRTLRADNGQSALDLAMQHGHAEVALVLDK